MTDITASDIERIWRQKSDDDLIEAAAQLGDYTPEGQRAIRSELTRRGLEDPVEQGGEAALEATTDEVPPRECAQCRVELRHLGTADLVPVLSRAAGKQPFDVYACPQCGHVDLFVGFAEEDADGDEETGEGA